MNSLRNAVMALVLVLSAAEPALAYVGPGAGLSLLGALWGLVLAVAAAVGFIILWPLKRSRRRARPRQAAVDGGTAQGAGEQHEAVSDARAEHGTAQHRHPS